MTTSNTTIHGRVLLLAERLRVEERLLIEAFADAGWHASLITPEEAATWATSLADRDGVLIGCSTANGHRETGHHARFEMNGRNETEQTIVISRLPAGRDAVALLSLLDDLGIPTINSRELTGLLASRDQLLRGLARRGLATLAATFAFGAEGVLAAADQAGYPAMLLPLNGDEPGVLVEDREAAEAVVEHRIVLGRQRAMLVRPELPHVPRRDVVIAGDDTFVATARDGGDASTDSGQIWQPSEHLTPEDIELASRLRDTLGAGVYVAEVADNGKPLLLDIKPLNGFRTIHNAGLDVAGAFVRLVENSTNGRADG